MQCKQHSVWIQAGVAIFGEGCGRSDPPEVYSRVSEFQRWISDEVTGESVAFEKFTSNNTDPDDRFVCSGSSGVAHTWVFIIISVTVCLTYGLALEQF